MSIQEQLEQLGAPKRMTLVPKEQRDQELLLIAYASLLKDGKVDMLKLMELLHRCSMREDECSGFCPSCDYQKACPKLSRGIKEAFNV